MVNPGEEIGQFGSVAARLAGAEARFKHLDVCGIRLPRACCGPARRGGSEIIPSKAIGLSCAWCCGPARRGGSEIGECLTTYHLQRTGVLRPGSPGRKRDIVEDTVSSCQQDGCCGPARRGGSEISRSRATPINLLRCCGPARRGGSEMRISRRSWRAIRWSVAARLAGAEARFRPLGLGSDIGLGVLRPGSPGRKRDSSDWATYRRKLRVLRPGSPGRKRDSVIHAQPDTDVVVLRPGSPGRKRDN